MTSINRGTQLFNHMQWWSKQSTHFLQTRPASGAEAEASLGASRFAQVQYGIQRYPQISVKISHKDPTLVLGYVQIYIYIYIYLHYIYIHIVYEFNFNSDKLQKSLGCNSENIALQLYFLQLVWLNVGVSENRVPGNLMV